MSLFGALSTAISGLDSQSAAFGNISDNVANSQTTGFKRVDTSFIDYLTTSQPTENEPGAVISRPDYINTVQGTITQTDNPLAMAIAGQGFFAVSQEVEGTTTNSQIQFAPQQAYTRAGDFQLDKDGYLVNGEGDYLNGWSVSASGLVNKTTLSPIQVSQAAAAPVATSTMDLSANLPPTSGAAASPTTSTVTIYDAQGQSHQLTLTFTSTGTNTWTLGVTDDASNSIGSASLTFGPDGTLASVTQGGTTTNAAGANASLKLNTAYPVNGGGTQQVQLNLGAIGQTTGLTQFAGSNYTVRGITQNGVPPGSFSGITTTSDGSIVANYDNGQSRTIAQVPIITFASPDSMQRQNGSAFTATLASGNPLAQDAGSNGAGSIVTSSIEASNVDISSEFSKLIVAQRAYSANAKIVTTADDMLQQTIDMKR